MGILSEKMFGGNTLTETVYQKNYGRKKPSKSVEEEGKIFDVIRKGRSI